MVVRDSMGVMAYSRGMSRMHAAMHTARPTHPSAVAMSSSSAPAYASEWGSGTELMVSWRAPPCPPARRMVNTPPSCCISCAFSASSSRSCPSRLCVSLSMSTSTTCSCPRIATVPSSVSRSARARVSSSLCSCVCAAVSSTRRARSSSTWPCSRRTDMRRRLTRSTRATVAAQPTSASRSRSCRRSRSASNWRFRMRELIILQIMSSPQLGTGASLERADVSMCRGSGGSSSSVASRCT
mmetsp:Transcript_13864/g.35389  ORF Transcript_13864/g.35389 Transcript_13864/m.35389 type:complete len:240 (+) Transcript_13864:382-1101(+)